jgi:ribosomal protein S8
MKQLKLNFNYLIASFVSSLNIGMIRKLRFIKIIKTQIAIRLLQILYREGVIRTYVIKSDLNIILVYFKYTDGNQFCNRLTIVSKPSKRCYMRSKNLSKIYSNNSFTGFYIISTPKGLTTSDYCLLQGRISGEILIRVELA